MNTVIGIDPGLSKCAFAVVKSDSTILDFGIIKTDASMKIDYRLLLIQNGIRDVISKHKDIKHASIEEVFINKNPLSSMKLGMARASAILACASKSINIHSYSATHIKKSLSGRGRATKEQIYKLIRLKYNIDIKKSFDIADAIAIALAHINYKNPLGSLKICGGA